MHPRLKTFSALQNRFNQKFITIFLIMDILFRLKMSKLYLTELKTHLNKFVVIAY